MSKAVKDLVTKEYRKRYEGTSSACVIDMTAMVLAMATIALIVMCTMSGVFIFRHRRMLICIVMV